MMKNHLAGGVRNGALTEEQAEEKFNNWLEEKAKAVDSKKSSLTDAKDKLKAEALAAEKATNEARIAAQTPEVEVAADATEEVEALEQAAEEGAAAADTEVAKEDE